MSIFGGAARHCSPFQQLEMHVQAAANSVQRFLPGSSMHLLLVNAPDRSIPVDAIFRVHARASTAQAFCLLVHFDGILRASR